MDRITPERLKAAYEAIGVAPISGQFLVERGGNVVACCALIAMEAAGFVGEIDWDSIGDSAADSYEYDAYSQGFVEAWDCPDRTYPKFPTCRRAYLDGFEDGVAARDAIHPKHHSDFLRELGAI